MKRWILIVAALAVGLLAVESRAQDKTYKLNNEGYVLNWLVIEPVPLKEDEQGGAALDSKKIKAAAAVTPKAGEKIKIDDQSLEWKSQVADDKGKLDINAIHGDTVEDCAAYAVCYLNADNDIKGVVGKVGSDDQVIIFLNGKEIFRFAEPRSFTADEDSTEPFALKKGVNTVVMIVVNEKADFAGSLKLVDASDNAIKGVTVSLTPPAK